jgi:hypothetical protein
MTSTAEVTPRTTTAAELERSLAELEQGVRRYCQTTVAARLRLVEQCVSGVARVAGAWVDAACAAKGLAPGNPCRAEEILAGPVATLRCLQLLRHSLRGISAEGRPRLPGKFQVGPAGRLGIPLVPAHGLYDRLVFSGFHATAWMQPGIGPENLAEHQAVAYRPENLRRASIALVLGAGNVSAIAATDTLGKLFQEGQVVLLKMSPVNEYLGPILAEALAALVEAGYLRIIYGDATLGAAAVADPRVAAVHITGAIESHDRIVWGPPGEERQHRQQTGQSLLTKPITSELGNVTPWIVVPGAYTDRQLAFQAENIVASVVNNASFNCVATKVVLTWKGWPQRDRFLDLLCSTLQAVPPRKAYYPGAGERYRRFAGREPEPSPSGTLPWTLLADLKLEQAGPWLREESFVGVFAELALEAADAQGFLSAAVDFVNERLWGTLAAALTLPPDFVTSGTARQLLEACIGRLRYGSVAINHWPGLLYAMMSPPWGGHPSSNLADAQSGLGTVHNTYLLDGVEKTVLVGPLTMPIIPLWFPSHPRAEAAAWALCDLYRAPAAWRLPRLMLNAAALRR